VFEEFAESSEIEWMYQMDIEMLQKAVGYANLGNILLTLQKEP
jgi:hypothetical protein